jgi:uncharacterized protein (DUF1697 family)
MPTWVCLPRALNLGSRNKVNMPRLRDALGEAGFADVRTYVQSGNIVLSSSMRSPARVAAAVGDVLRESFSVDTPVVIRTPAQLQAVALWDPFADQSAERPASVHVLHLETEPDPAALAALLDADWGDDRVAVRGLEIVIAYGQDITASRLQHGPMLKRLGVVGTARNWRTLLALVDLV